MEKSWARGAALFLILFLMSFLRTHYFRLPGPAPGPRPGPGRSGRLRPPATKIHFQKSTFRICRSSQNDQAGVLSILKDVFQHVLWNNFFQSRIQRQNTRTHSNFGPHTFSQPCLLQPCLSQPCLLPPWMYTMHGSGVDDASSGFTICTSKTFPSAGDVYGFGFFAQTNRRRNIFRKITSCIFTQSARQGQFIKREINWSLFIPRTRNSHIF